MQVCEQSTRAAQLSVKMRTLPSSTTTSSNAESTQRPIRAPDPKFSTVLSSLEATAYALESLSRSGREPDFTPYKMLRMAAERRAACWRAFGEPKGFSFPNLGVAQ